MLRNTIIYILAAQIGCFIADVRKLNKKLTMQKPQTMFRKSNYSLQLIAAFLFGFGAGISIGFYLTGDTFLTVLFAAIVGLVMVLFYFSYLLFSR